MPRNRSEKIPARFACFNAKQLEHMRNETMAVIGVQPFRIQDASWLALSQQERNHLCEDFELLRELKDHYREEHRATQSK